MATVGSNEQVRVLTADGVSPPPMADCRRPVASGATPVCFLIGVGQFCVSLIGLLSEHPLRQDCNRES